MSRERHSEGGRLDKRKDKSYEEKLRMEFFLIKHNKFVVLFNGTTEFQNAKKKRREDGLSFLTNSTNEHENP